MIIPFYKYQGTGNDFVIIDNRETQWLTREDHDRVQFLCDRRFGIGADGLILLCDHPDYDFEMIYFNADGKESSMCGNGGRCISAFAAYRGLIEDHCTFLAIDGAHEAVVKENDWVELKMSDVKGIESGEDYFLLDTGSPHYVIFVEDIHDINVVENGQAIRYSKRFRKEGVNVNFVETAKDKIIVATYERGVEDETLSCGTGVTAAAIANFLRHPSEKSRATPIESKGGNLLVRIEPNNHGGFQNIWLCGKAQQVFKGEINLG